MIGRCISNITPMIRKRMTILTSAAVGRWGHAEMHGLFILLIF